MPIISVIVPVYKVEDYLCRCVDSVLAQSYTNFELILVDDGSPDSCPKICEDYAQADDRIKVIHKQNGGLSDARNAGIEWMLDNSDSEWLTFIDSDDWVHKEYLERLLAAAEDTNVKISVCAHETTLEKNQNPQQTMSPELIEAEEFYTMPYSEAVSAWGKLYKRECFETLRFPYGKLHEDLFIIPQLIFNKQKVAFISKPMYYYYINPNGITFSQWRPARWDEIEAFDQLLLAFKNSTFHKAFDHTVIMYWGQLTTQYGEWMRLNPCAYPKYKKRFRRKVRYLLKHYNSILKKTPKNAGTYYNLAFPVRMWVYWTIQGIRSKFKNQI